VTQLLCLSQCRYRQIIKYQLPPLPAGGLTSTGAKAIIPYMPYSDSASQIIYVTNLGATEGDIMVKALDDNGATFDLGKVSVAGPNKVTEITYFISNALQAKGFVSGKLAIYIKVLIPANALIVNASYNAGGNRGFVQVAIFARLRASLSRCLKLTLHCILRCKMSVHVKAQFVASLKRL